MKRYEVIVDVCKTKNFTKTAQNLNYSQAAVSQAVKSFEKEMGFPLFERRKSGVELLPVARDVLQSLNKIIEEEHRLQELSDSLTKTECGVVKIGTIFSIGINLLPGILKDFHRLYPEIKFDIFSGEYDEIYNLLKDGEIDLAFTSKDGAEGFTSTELFRDEFMAVLPPDHPLSEKAELSIYDFQGYPYIPSGEKFGYEIGEIFNTINVQPACSFSVTEELISHKMIEAGFGISVSTEYFLESVPSFANVCVRPFKEHFQRTLVVARNESHFCPAATTTFIRFLNEQLNIDF